MRIKFNNLYALNTNINNIWGGGIQKGGGDFSWKYKPMGFNLSKDNQESFQKTRGLSVCKQM